MSLELKKLEYIDALRGIAIFLVVMIHASMFSLPQSEWLIHIVRSGNVGVQLFYVASALTLCMSWSMRANTENSPITKFYIRRFFRIAPLFYLAILTYLLINGFEKSYWAPNGIKWWFIPLTISFLHGFHPETINSVVPGGWSIAVEMSFYAIFPILIYHVNTLRKCLYLFLLSIVMVRINDRLVHIFIHYPGDISYIVNTYSWLNFLGQFPVFVTGMAVFYILKEPSLHQKARYFSLIGLPFFVFLMAYPNMTIKIEFIEKLYLWQFGSTFSGLAFGCFAILISKYNFSFFVNNFFIYIGRLSYGIYLSHFAVLYLSKFIGLNKLLAGSNFNSMLFFITILCATTVAAKLLQVLIENPGMLIGKIVIEKMNGQSNKVQMTT